VHVASRVGERLRNAGFSPTVSHRDLASRPDDSMEGARLDGHMKATTMESQ
jgi:RNase adapter protein RapZ